MATEVETVKELAALLKDNGHHRVGIDGHTGCGKTTLAKELSKSLGLDLLSIDDYLDRNQGSFCDQVKFKDLKTAYDIKSGCIVEGVCLLQVLEAAQLDIDALIYVKRMQNGIWADESECEVNLENVDQILEEVGKKVKLINSEANLPPLVEEIIRYHASHRPLERADFLYLINV